MKKILLATVLAGSMSSAMAAEYVLDTKGAHAAIQFKVSHLGYSWNVGRFNTFTGTLDYDENKPEATKVQVEVKTNSVDSNHAERDKHLRSGKFLNADKFPTASFISTAYTPKDEMHGTLSGNLTLLGVTKPIQIDVTKIGEGKDPWGGYRIGFTGTTEFAMKDFGIKQDLGPKSQIVYLTLDAEWIKK